MSYNYLVGIECENDVFTYSFERPYLKEFLKNDDSQRFQNIFEKINLDDVIKEISHSISKWKINTGTIINLGSYFEFIVDRQILYLPEVIHRYKLKKEYTPSQALDYFMNNEINIDSNIAFIILILCVIRKFWGDYEFNKLAPIFILQSDKFENLPLFKTLFRTKKYGQLKPCDIDEQKNKINTFPIGTYCNINSSIGWYQNIVAKHNFNKIDINKIVNQSIYIGNGRFIGFWNEYNLLTNDDTISCQIKHFDEIIDSITINGKRNILENVKNENDFYKHRYIIYNLDNQDGFNHNNKFNKLDNNKITETIATINNLDESKSSQSSKLLTIHNHFLPIGIAGFSDLYFDTQFFEKNNYQDFLIGQSHYKDCLSALLLAYQKGKIRFNEILDIYTSINNLQKEYPIFAMTDTQRHIVFNLIGWNDTYPKSDVVVQNISKEQFINFPTSITYPELLSQDNNNKYPIVYYNN
jgi:hypothetical protein